QSSEGGTPFGVLFLCFSFFLILSSLLLVGLLYRLNLERRAARGGVVFAAGFPPPALRALLPGGGGGPAAGGARRRALAAAPASRCRRRCCIRASWFGCWRGCGLAGLCARCSSRTPG